LGLDSGTRGYNPRCRDTVALPPSISLEWAKARVEREKADIWLNPRARRRGRRDPGRGWALQAFIKTPAPLPHPSSPPAPGPVQRLLNQVPINNIISQGPAQFFVPPISGGFSLNRKVLDRNHGARQDSDREWIAMEAGRQGRTRMGGWEAQRNCVRCMRGLCCGFVIDDVDSCRDESSSSPPSTKVSASQVESVCMKVGVRVCLKHALLCCQEGRARECVTTMVSATGSERERARARVCVFVPAEPSPCSFHAK
jgi:hypothetical protein